MAGTGLPTDQLEKYRASVHGRVLLEEGDLGAPSCNNCHGNHGAVPPGVSSVHNVCGVCHPSNDGLFVGSTHNLHFQELDFPGCVTCHDHHEIHRLTTAAISAEDDGVCELCHSTDDDGGLAAQSIRETLYSLEALRDSAHALVTDAEQKGMEVSEAQYVLTQVNSNLVKTGNLLHGFAIDPLKEASEEGVTGATEAIVMAHAALHEYQVRRRGLVISLVFLILGTVALYAKIRQRNAALAAREATSEPSGTVIEG